MPEDLAREAERAGLSRAFAHAPGEIAAAVRLAEEQSEAIRTPLPLSFRGGVGVGPSRAFRAWPIRPTPNLSPEGEGRSLVQIAAAFANGSLTPPAILESLLTRIDTLDGRLHSFVLVDRDGARAQALASETRWKSGTPLGPLDGVPVGIKDVIDVAGLPTRCHSRVTSAGPAERDAGIVARLRGAGAVIVGKLATHEFAIGGPAFDLPFPPARNPWDLDHHPGGSSSGAGAAVAAGLIPLAVGTDTAGSVRNPASACGIVGLKPGRGALPLDGVVPLAWSLDHAGLLTRDVADMALAAGALGIDLRPQARGRVGYVRHFHTGDMIATPEVDAALDRAADAFGAVDVTLPPLTAFALVNRIILQGEGFTAHGAHLREQPEALSALTRAALLPGAFMAAETLALALRAKESLTASVDAVFAEVDLLLTASSMEPACRIDDPAEIARTYMLQARSPFNVTGHPALAMAAGISANGLPLSLQLAARKGEEGRLLAAAAEWEAAMGGPIAPPIL